ncbi:MAG: hypothetical protein ACYTFY_13575 [Planctomycetota bacterium]|jgi:spermidine/putrescine-binding protein
MNSGKSFRAGKIIFAAVIITAAAAVIYSLNQSKKLTLQKQSTKQQNTSQTNIGNENTLRLFLWEGYSPKEFVKKFEKEASEKYKKDIKIKVKYAESPDDFFDAIRGHEFDLVTISHHTIKDERFNFIKNILSFPLIWKISQTTKTLSQNCRKLTTICQMVKFMVSL